MMREPARLRRFHPVSGVNVAVLGVLMLGSLSAAQASAPTGTELAAATVDDRGLPRPLGRD